MSQIHQGQIDQLQQDAVDRLVAQEALAGIQIFYEQTKDIASAIEIAVGKTSGICIVVTPPICKSSKPNLKGPYFDATTFEVNIPEFPTINNSIKGLKKSAALVAEICAKALHHMATRDGRVLIVSAIVPVPDPQFRVYRVSVNTAFGLHD